MMKMLLVLMSTVLFAGIGEGVNDRIHGKPVWPSFVNGLKVGVVAALGEVAAILLGGV